VLSPGAILADKYRVISVIGEGGFGQVYLGYDQGMERYVAIKELLQDATTPEEWAAYQARFRKEARTVSQFSHPHVVSAYALETDALDNMYLILEYVDGGSLEEVLAGKIDLAPPPPPATEDGGPLDELSAEEQFEDASAPADRHPPPMTPEPVGAPPSGPRTLDVAWAIDIGIDLCHAIEAIYRRDIVHRDIKPSNILLTREGKAKLTDFGVAQVGHETRRTQEAVGHPGTPAYKSPEQSTSTGYVDQRSDIYALGLVLYEMLTGRLYVRNRIPPRAYNPDVPHALNAVVIKALQEAPIARYQTAEALRQDLQTVREQSTWGQVRITLTGIAEGMPTNRIGAAVGAVVLLMALLGLYRFGSAVAMQDTASSHPIAQEAAPASTSTTTITPPPTEATQMAMPVVPELGIRGTPEPSILGDVPTPTATPSPQTNDPGILSVGETQLRTFAQEGEIHRLLLRVKAGRTYVITTSNLAVGVDTTLQLTYNGLVVENDDISSGTLASEVSFTADEDGTAAITVSNAGLFGPERTYELSAMLGSPPATPIPTATLTATATIRPTAGPTWTPRPTFTPGPSLTPTRTNTPRPTWTPRPSITPTRTRTRTPTRTFTPTRTLTPTLTPTPTLTYTPSLTPTPSETPTLTPIPTETPAPTATPTVTPERTPLEVKPTGPPVK
jgi:hypothetical protein